MASYQLPTWLVSVLFLSIFSVQASAKVNNDFQNWSIITLNKQINDKWGASVELQNRLVGSLSTEGTFFIRPAIFYRVNKNISIWQGFAWNPTFQEQGYLNENHIWQQVAVNKDIHGVKFFAWNRLEERFIENADGTSIRDRIRIGAKIPIFQLKTWKFITFDELFINLNEVNNGPAKGIDQNWIFTGVEKQINKNTTLEIGYLLNYLNREPEQLQHALNLNLNINI
jgi:hypothetical protein